MNLLCPGDEKQLRAVFVSGNEDKVKDVLKVLGDEMVLITQKIDLVEIQGQPVEVAIQKCVEAKKFSQETVIIEDTALCMNALGGMPGPYIKWFMKSLDPTGIYQLISGFSDRNAIVVSTVAIGIHTEEGPRVITFEARVAGEIVQPRGTAGDRNGWDACFQPKGQSFTYGEMEASTRESYCARQKALRKLLQHLQP